MDGYTYKNSKKLTFCVQNYTRTKFFFINNKRKETTSRINTYALGKLLYIYL